MATPYRPQPSALPGPFLPPQAAPIVIGMDHQSPTSALLVMDVQRGVVARFASDGALLECLRGAIEAARAKEVPVIFVRVAFRPGHPEVSDRNRTFAALTRPAETSFGESDEATQIHPALEPRPEDAVVVKKRVSAFAGSDLEVLLRSLGVTHLILSGIATSGVVLSTLREAADRDYQLTVLSDACADGDAEVQRILMEKIFPRQAEILTVVEWGSRPAG
jgi:nicotinamidase-related amidase